MTSQISVFDKIRAVFSDKNEAVELFGLTEFNEDVLSAVSFALYRLEASDAPYSDFETVVQALADFIHTCPQLESICDPDFSLDRVRQILSSRTLH
jgi:hypothetical protein